MTTYDAPGITDPENVDALTHQQIYDAFQTVGDHCADIVTTWQQAGDRWRTSTTGLVQAVRTAVDGHWTGAAAEAAVQAVTGYGTQATDLADLFDQTGQIVANTSQAAQTTRAYVPKPVPVTADQTKDPTEFDTQTRNAGKAQDDARQVMQQRYVLPFTTEDAHIPTFPPANSTGTGDGPVTALAAAGNGAQVSIPGIPSIEIPGLGMHPDSTVTAGVQTSLLGTPVTIPVDPGVAALVDGSSTTRPTVNDVFFGPTTRLDRAELTDDSQVPAATRPTSTTPVTATTSPYGTSPHGAPTDPAAATTGDGTHDAPRHPDSDFLRPDHGTHTSPVDYTPQTDGTPSAESHTAAHDSASNQAVANQPGANQPGASQAAASQTPTPHADTGGQGTGSGGTPSTTATGTPGATATGAPGSAMTGTPGATDTGTGGTPAGTNPTPNSPRLATPLPGTSLPGSALPGSALPGSALPGSALPGALSAPSIAGSALGSAASIAGPALGAGSMIPNPPSTPMPNIPAAPVPPTPAPPSAPAPAPSPGFPAPVPNIHAPGPNSPMPVSSSPAPGPNSQVPGPNTQAPRPITPVPSSGAPTPAPTTPPPGPSAAANSIPPDVLTEPAATAITGAAAAELSTDPQQHHDPRAPRLRVGYQGDRDRMGKVDLSNESTTAEMAHTEDHVQPTIGVRPRHDRPGAEADPGHKPLLTETPLTEHLVQATIGDPEADPGNGSTPAEMARTENNGQSAGTARTERYVEPIIGECTRQDDQHRADTKSNRGNTSAAEAAHTDHYVQPTIGAHPPADDRDRTGPRADPSSESSTAGTTSSLHYVQPTIGDHPPRDHAAEQLVQPAIGVYTEATPGKHTPATTPTESYVQPTIGDYIPRDDRDRTGPRADPGGESSTAGTASSEQYVQPTIGE